MKDIGGVELPESLVKLGGDKPDTVAASPAPTAPKEEGPGKKPAAGKA